MVRAVIVAGIAASLLAAGPRKKAKPAATPAPTATPVELGIRLERGDWTHYVGDDEEAQEIVRGAFAEAGLETMPAIMPSDVTTKWKVTESKTAHPYTARRYRLMASVHEGKCWLRIRAETNIELEPERRKWTWGVWVVAPPNAEEAGVFEKARSLLLERLPKPDPEATPLAGEAGEAAASPEPYEVTSIGVAPIPIYQPAPVRPKGKKAKGPGTVVLEITVDATGAVTGAKITQSDPVFDDAALAAVKTWRYQPVFLHGEPITWKKDVTVTF